MATVPVEPERIWDVLTQPELVAEMTPLVDRIERRGQLWTWTLAGISGLGLEVAPSFTVRMSFVPISRIDYRHEPPPGVTERAGVAQGTFYLYFAEKPAIFYELMQGFFELVTEAV